MGTSLVVYRLGLCASNAWGPCPIPGQGTKIPHAMGATKPVCHNKRSLHVTTIESPYATTRHNKDQSSRVPLHPNSKRKNAGISLVVRWLRICLLIQGMQMQVQSLVGN